MRALEPEVVDAVWAVIEPLIPPAPEKMSSENPQAVNWLAAVV